MADKVILTNVSTFVNDATAVANINANNATITSAFDNTLSRDGTQPNSMSSFLDMNNNGILNLPAPVTANSPVRLVDVAAGAIVINSNSNPGQVLYNNSGGFGGFGNWNNSTSTFTVPSNLANSLQLTGAGTGGTPQVAAVGSDTNIPINITSKGLADVLLISNGNIAFTAVNNASNTVNWLQTTGSPTGSAPQFITVGSDTNIGMTLVTKGTGVLTSFCNGATALSVSNASSSVVNNLLIQGNTTGVPPTISAVGTDGNINIALSPKGSGAVTLGAQFTNFVNVIGNSTGNPPTIMAQGGDTNIPLGIYSKGSSNIFFVSNNATALNVQGPASAVNYIQVTSATTGLGPGIASVGSDTNTPLQLTAKGNANVNLVSNGSNAFTAIASLSAVNYIQATGVTTGSAPQLLSLGPDTNIGMTLISKGTGAVVAFTNNGISFSSSNTSTSAVNYVQAQGAATANPPAISAVGSDTNIDLAILGQGTGTVKFGSTSSFSANGSVATTMTSLGPTGSHTTIQEWLTIKDSSGTIRYIPCY